jgi:hypothetical protein
MRCQPRHFIPSKAMCWAAPDRGIKLAEGPGAKGAGRRMEKKSAGRFTGPGVALKFEGGEALPFGLAGAG